VKPGGGYCGGAEGGTLFPDEIGEAPPDVQAMLLRVLETGETQQIGAQKGRKADVRVVAATDADLEEGIRRGTFRAPLLHRLAGYEIRLPPLRERREDVARLLLRFLEEELRAVGAARAARPTACPRARATPPGCPRRWWRSSSTTTGRATCGSSATWPGSSSSAAAGAIGWR